MPRVLIDRSSTRLQISTNIEHLKLQSYKEYWDLIIRCLNKALEDPSKYYTGRKPPEVCQSVKQLKHCEMFAFSVFDPITNKTVYTKFAIKKMHKGDEFYGHITCHEDEKH